MPRRLPQHPGGRFALEGVLVLRRLRGLSGAGERSPQDQVGPADLRRARCRRPTSTPSVPWSISSTRPSTSCFAARLADNMDQFLTGVRGLGLTVLGGVGAIASIHVGLEEATLRAGRELFERGLLRPVGRLPRRAPPLRRPSSSDQRQPPPESIAGLVDAIANLSTKAVLSPPALSRPWNAIVCDPAATRERGGGVGLVRRARRA